jgi:hypothetical protein
LGWLRKTAEKKTAVSVASQRNSGRRDAEGELATAGGKFTSRMNLELQALGVVDAKIFPTLWQNLLASGKSVTKSGVYRLPSIRFK